MDAGSGGAIRARCISPFSLGTATQRFRPSGRRHPYAATRSCLYRCWNSSCEAASAFAHLPFKSWLVALPDTENRIVASDFALIAQKRCDTTCHVAVSQKETQGRLQSTTHLARIYTDSETTVVRERNGVGEAKPALAAGTRRLPNSSVICSLKMPVRNLSDGGVRASRIVQLKWPIGISRRNHYSNEGPRTHQHSASRKPRFPGGNGSHLVLLPKTISRVMGRSQPGSRPSSLTVRGLPCLRNS
jgi:hypothetical protein